jgi:uncharacterized protein (DUF302 family)
MAEIDYTVPTSKGFDEAVDSVLARTKDKGFGVLHVHDVQAILAGKGIERAPLKIIEVCHPRHAHEALQADIRISLMLPCPISVYSQDGQTYISALRPNVISRFYPEAGLEELAAAVDRAIVAIVDESK